MRRIAAAVAVIFLCLTMTVSAASVHSQATISESGAYSMTIQLTFTTTAPVNKLTYPLPGRAQTVTVNGVPVSAKLVNGFVQVDITNFCQTAGEHTLTIHYSQSNEPDLEIIGKGKQRWVYSMALLSGFAYPLDSFQFTVVFPKEITVQPEFTSSYYQDQIGDHLQFVTMGNRLTGQATLPLKDRETLLLTIPSEGMFPTPAQEDRLFSIWQLLLMGIAGCGVLYSILFLRSGRIRSSRCTVPPAGLTAGQMGGVLTGQGADLTMMVLTWAQLGYILIHLDTHGRVLLHKRMGMGNERSVFENHCFRALFGKHQMVEGTGDRYARLSMQVAANRAGRPRVYRRRAGSRKFLQGLLILLGAVSGGAMGSSISGPLTVLITVLGCLLGSVAGYFIPRWAGVLHLRGKRRMVVSLIWAAAWLLLGKLSGKLVIAAATVLLLLLGGMVVAYGGRRNESGVVLRSQVLGLRHHLRHTENLSDILQTNPDYFFTLIPYAMALGVEKPFTRQFPNQLPNCPYLTTGLDGHMTANEWCRVFQRAVTALDAGKKRLERQRFRR